MGVVSGDADSLILARGSTEITVGGERGIGCEVVPSLDIRRMAGVWIPCASESAIAAEICSVPAAGRAGRIAGGIRDGPAAASPVCSALEPEGGSPAEFP